VKNPLKWLITPFETWREIDREWLDRPREPETDEADRGDRKRRRHQAAAAPAWNAPDNLKPLIVLVVVAVSLTVQEYFGQENYFAKHWPPPTTLDGGEFWQLESFAWWSGWRVFGYIVIPILAIWAMPGERVRDYFISFKGFTKHIWVYVILFLLIAPAVYVASTTESFRHTYPFYKLAERSAFDLWAWEAMYAAQFVALEFFFRGFMLKALAPRFGSGAIFVMIVPYCMIHYGKPLPETLGAIGAGLILGTLAMKTKSIWGGVLIHISVAISMDVLALRD
jgi:membrane protease YdiL (CAAX protease family)